MTVAEQWIHIDGAQGEGGGQILRSSLALSLVTQRLVRLENIRARRAKPGLMRQHLTAVRAATEISGAEAIGAEVGSQMLEFWPGKVRAGRYHFSVGTAGSATLVVQTVLPALLIADSPSELVLEGGTHNPWAPPFDFLAHTFFPLINRMGPKVSAALEQYGFFPAGGGRFAVGIEPASTLEGFELLERGEILQRCATALVANLPRSIGQREINVAAEKLSWPPSSFHVNPSIKSPGPGNAVLIEIIAEHVHEVFCGFGRIGVSAEKVSHEVVDEVRTYLASGVPVGPYLADQLLLPFGIAAWKSNRGGSFRTVALTRHSTTHIQLLERFLEVAIHVEREPNACRVTVEN